VGGWSGERPEQAGRSGTRLAARAPRTLTTTGRRSGQARRTPLIYGRDGDRYLVVASKGGSEAPPAWYVNLRADPKVRVQVGAEVFDATARAADPDEQARLWPVMTAIWPEYDVYQTRTRRPIPVVVITPALRG
jgi:deazaflavin-dependent oxidoreductase (nitroreductase family)